MSSLLSAMFQHSLLGSDKARRGFIQFLFELNFHILLKLGADGKECIFAGDKLLPSFASSIICLVS